MFCSLDRLESPNNAFHVQVIGSARGVAPKPSLATPCHPEHSKTSDAPPQTSFVCHEQHSHRLSRALSRALMPRIVATITVTRCHEHRCHALFSRTSQANSHRSHVHLLTLPVLVLAPEAQDHQSLQQGIQRRAWCSHVPGCTSQ
jgi:hypothetical protein